MSLYYQDYASLLKGISFIQERDIDYAPYDWKNYEGVQEAVTVQSPVGVAEDGTITPFTSTYKGGGYEIRGISFATKGTAVGFIGENQRSIQNVFLVSDWENNDFTGTTAVSNPYLSYTGTIGSNRNVYMGLWLESTREPFRIVQSAVTVWVVTESCMFSETELFI